MTTSSKIILETLMLDYGPDVVEDAYRNSKKYFGKQAWFYNYDVAATEYGSHDGLVLASLLYGIERKGNLDGYLDAVKEFVNVLEKESRKLSNNIRLDSFSEVQQEYLYPPVDSAETTYLILNSPLTPPHLQGDSLPTHNYREEGVSYASKLWKLTAKQRDALEVFSNTRSRSETGRLLGLSAVAVKQLLQRARKALQ